MTKLELFKAEDFDTCIVECEGSLECRAFRIANAKLQAYLETLPPVYGRVVNGYMCGFSDVRGWNNTHTARLIDIRKIGSEGEK